MTLRGLIAERLYLRGVGDFDFGQKLAIHAAMYRVFHIVIFVPPDYLEGRLTPCCPPIGTADWNQ